MSANLETIQANTPLFAYALGVQDERERIIALLESILFLEDYPPFNKTVITEEAIALIRGEN